jgi:DNA-3-methyladenine glycosylase
LKKLKREFYRKNSLELARALLGKYLVHIVQGETIIGRIVDVEAYMGVEDKEAHSYNNRRTERNEVMYGEAGFAYVYMIYGMYYCMNVVAAETDNPQAVLIRGLEPVEGLEKMAEMRYGKPLSSLSKAQVRNFTDGPGKLCKAIGITRADNGKDLCGDELFIAEAQEEKFETETGKRINIDYAEEAKEYLWRFYIKGKAK